MSIRSRTRKMVPTFAETKTTFKSRQVALYNMDVRELIQRFPDNYFDSVVTDPPYGLDFMGRAWDSKEGAGFSSIFWGHVFRVLKPGAHIVCFGGTRTYHRMVCAIEDAGFEIRDQLAWVYGTGFPKSLDIAKAIDKAAGAVRELSGREPKLVNPRAMNPHGAGERQVDPGARYDNPVTDAAKHWDGWGTALKPAWEPICLARKPLIGTNVENVLAHGTGAINVGACRVEVAPRMTHGDRNVLGSRDGQNVYGKHAEGLEYAGAEGRFPANLCHDGSPEVLAGFPESKSGIAVTRNGGGRKIGGDGIYGGSKPHEGVPDSGYTDSGSAARFFYCAKASKRDRAGSKHPTVKPVALMRWLARLVTPPGGIILEPFAGSGTTLEAAMVEGFRIAGVEKEEEFYQDAKQRILSLGAN